MSIIEGEQQAAPVSVSLSVGDKEVTFETGKLAKQADGAVVVRSGDTMVLATAQGRTEGREGADFFPLTIDVEERMYAAGSDRSITINVNVTTGGGGGSSSLLYILYLYLYIYTIIYI